MEIILGKNVAYGDFKPFSKADKGFDLGLGRIRVSGNNSAGYRTSIPVSDLAYRQRFPTRARAAYRSKTGWHEFTIWDDWGTRHEIAISDDEEGRALALAQIASLEANGLLVERSKLCQQ